MDDIFQLTRMIHILSGGLGLFVAPGAMLTRKGGLWHRRWGKVYFWSMVVVVLTGVLLAFVRFNPFLLLIAVFSFYLAFSGYRALYRKTPQQRAGILDWGVSVLMLTGGASFIGYGIYLLLILQTVSFGIVAIVFGSIGLASAISDIRSFLRPPTDKLAWWFSHMSGMLAAYIATVSAFSVVNFHFLPPAVRWLWPTVIGTIGTTVWTRYYREKFRRADEARNKSKAGSGRIIESGAA
ncbi:MAG: hypothetical protein H0U54_13185 [Acidobacteria bacterium]|nr:hypothetical protein [Acidobacteriota bacterium]